MSLVHAVVSSGFSNMESIDYSTYHHIFIACEQVATAYYYSSSSRSNESLERSINCIQCTIDLKDEQKFPHLSRKKNWTACLRCGKEVWIFIACWEFYREKTSYIKTTHNMSGFLSHWSTIILRETLHKRRHQKPLNGDKKCKFSSYVSLLLLLLLFVHKPCNTWRLLILH